jgi:hypothetical protein
MMATRFRRLTALATLLLLLTAQALPALDICVCNAPEDTACCESNREPAAKPTCCDKDHLVAQAGGSASDQASLSAGACQRQTVSAEVSSAALRTNLEFKTASVQTAVMNATILCMAVDTPAILLVASTPTTAHAPPLFLLHASLRL